MLLSLTAWALALGCQQPARSPTGPEIRHCEVGRIDSDDAPRIDADLSDPCWANAPEIGPLRQVEPMEALVTTQRTVVRLLRDDRALYLAIECFDTAPGSIRAQLRERDAELDPDDRVEWVIDTFGQSTLGYLFQIGAGGALGDGLMGPTRFTKSWDTIWDARARVTDKGWQAEAELPFRSLAFPEDATEWRFNFRRVRRVSNEEYRWTSAEQRLFFFRLQEMNGRMHGVGGASPGVGVDLVPYVKYRQSRQRMQDPGWNLDPDAGGDVFYRLTPSLTGVLTFFTDFAETENDDRQINLTRFPLFFPEKRDFFLEDESRFNFGPRSRSLIPFFSRRIGLGDDGEIPIIFGAKLAGQAGPWGIGVLDAYTGEGGGNDFDRNLFVARLNHSFDGDTQIGGLVTAGRPQDPGEATTFGLDFYHRMPRAIGDQNVELWLYGLGTQTSGAGGDDFAYNAEARGRGREWEWRAQARQIGDEFNPELGFVRRPGIRDFDARLEWNPRVPVGSAIRTFSFQLDGEAVFDLDDEVQDLRYSFRPFGVSFNSEDQIEFDVSRDFEHLDDGFTIFDDVTVAPGDYWQTRVRGQVRFSPGRAISGRIESSYGDLYDGTSFQYSAELDWRVTPLIITGGRFAETQAELASGRFQSHLAEARLDFQFDPQLSVRNLVQWDNDSDNLAFQSRLRWIMRPGSDLFVVLAGGWDRGEDGTFRPDEQNFTVKLTHTLRF